MSVCDTGVSWQLALGLLADEWLTTLQLDSVTCSAAMSEKGVAR